MRKVVLPLIVFLCLISHVSQAQDFKLALDQDSILIGDHLLMTLSLSYNRGEKAFLPQLVDSVILFDLIEIYPSDSIDNKLTQSILMTQFNEGRYEVQLPALIIRGNGDIDTIYSNISSVVVNTLEVDTSQALKAIKTVKSIPFPWKEFLKKLILYLIPILLVLILLVWYYIRKKKIILFPEKPKTMLDYYEGAIDELSNLEHQKLWQNDQVKEYYLSLSEILRAYLEGRFGINAMESTTDEIKADLILEEAMKLKLGEVLTQADLAKFAKFKPQGDENIRMIKIAKDFVRHTKPQTIKEINAK
jgi:hypothetical protein